MEALSVSKFLSLFELFSNRDKKRIADVIQRRALADRWADLETRLPDTDISEEDVMAEVKAVRQKRHGKG